MSAHAKSVGARILFDYFSLITEKLRQIKILVFTLLFGKIDRHTYLLVSTILYYEVW